MESVPNTTCTVPNTLMRRGDVVMVAMAGGCVAERIVWSATADLVHVCSLATFEKLSRDEPAAQPIAFPRRDVQGVEEADCGAICA